MHSVGICVDPDQTAPIHRLRGCACWILSVLVSNVIRFSVGKDTYINEQCGQPDLNAA